MLKISLDEIHEDSYHSCTYGNSSKAHLQNKTETCENHKNRNSAPFIGQLPDGRLTSDMGVSMILLSPYFFHRPRLT